MGRSFIDEDPLSLAMLPPPDETPAQRHAREHAESEARKRSEEIDDMLRKERDGEKRKRRPVKLLLLGQSESGKTATLKNFQLTYARKVWTEERIAWKSVIWFNLVRNVNDILTDMARDMQAASSPQGYHMRPGTGDSSNSDLGAAEPGPSSSRRPTTGSGRNLRPLKWRESHRILQLQLGPLRRVQSELEHRLGAGSQELKSTDVYTAAPFSDNDVASPNTPMSPGFGYGHRRVLQEFSINSSNGWKSALEKLRSHAQKPSLSKSSDLRRAGRGDDDETGEVLYGLMEAIRTLWNDDVVKELLNRRRTRIEDSAGFFLNDVERIASPDYQPSDDDIVRARLRTLGVQEYRFVFEHGRSMGQEWRLYDVGGTRSSRAAWYPYFDDVDAIIFLAPISCFDEKLIEDRKVNRLEDSYLLWRSVCSCKLLARTQIILFLNKCDLLQAKLLRGVKIKDSVPSFGNRANDLSTATRYFQQHFKEIFKQHSPVPRPFYVHLTSVIDTRSTAVTLGVVEESILRDHLRRADLM